MAVNVAALTGVDDAVWDLDAVKRTKRSRLDPNTTFSLLSHIQLNRAPTIQLNRAPTIRLNRAPTIQLNRALTRGRT